MSPSQLAKVTDLGEERTADADDVLFQVGDHDYPFIAILKGEVAMLDGAGNEIVRQGPSNFLGELSLLSGQSAFLTAVVTEPLRYIEVDRDALRALLFDQMTARAPARRPGQDLVAVRRRFAPARALRRRASRTPPLW